MSRIVQAAPSGFLDFEVMMSSNTVLGIGNLVFSWRNMVPSFLTFLFSETEFYTKPKKLKHKDDWYDEIGYSTSCSQALRILDRFGYNTELFSEVYATFYNQLQKTLVESLEEEYFRESGRKLSAIEIENATLEHLAAYPKQSLEKDIEDFIAFMSMVIDADFGSDALAEPYVLSMQGKPEIFTIPVDEYIRKGKETLVDFDNLEMYFYNKARLLPPSVVRVASLFNESSMFEYPEVLSLMYARLVLEASPKDSKVTLNLADIVEDIEEARGMHVSLVDSLVEKVHLYNKVFAALSNKEEDIQAQFAKKKAQVLVADLQIYKNPDDKGKSLEELMSAIFETCAEFQVAEKRYSTGDEEIDLLVKNNVSKPFWISLTSPLIFVECKNWSALVGSKELRDFEVKIQNHGPLVKVGLFIAPGGVTSSFLDEMKRISRDDYVVSLIKLADIQEFISGKKTLPDWLEDILCRPK